MAVASLLSACKAEPGPAPSGAAAPVAPPPAPAAAYDTPSAQAEVPANLLAPGADVPDLRAVAHNGQEVSLRGFKGRPLVVYFYPKDDTPGCTIEAQEIRDLWSSLQSSNAVVVGVSTDDNESHKAFAEKYELPFLLVPDTDHEIANAFGVPVVNGKVKRISFVIDKAGKVQKVFPKVTPKGHGAELLAAVTETR